MLPIFKHLLEKFEISLRSWPEVVWFHAIVYQTRALRDSDVRPALTSCASSFLIIYADPNLEVPQQFAKLATTVARRMATRPPSYEHIVSLLDVLMSSLDFATASRPDVGLDHFSQRLELDSNEDLEGLMYYTGAEARLSPGIGAGAKAAFSSRS